jgi:hypothetical protein
MAVAMIEREDFDWGVCLTTRPFVGGLHQALAIRVEIGHYKHNRGADTRITFSGANSTAPLRIVDAQTWNTAMTAIINETRLVVAQMKADAMKDATKKKR